jgi:hypothetical protein
VKILPPEIEEDATFSERFTREARALAKLNHQNIVSIYDFGKSNGLHYFIMEYVDGANLRHVIQNGDITPAEALAIVPQICAALQFAHDEGIVHRDIKPENILIGKQGRVKIADFGLAKLLGKGSAEYSLTRTDQAMGTVHYMAPEQMRGAGSVDHRADIYSLGVVFYEMLTGQLPLGRFAPPSKQVDIDARLDKVVLRSLESDPERRYQTANDVKTDLELATSQRADPAVQQPPVMRPDSESVESLDMIKIRLKAPAIGLLVAGVINCFAGLLGLLPILFFILGFHSVMGIGELVVLLIGSAIGGLQIVAAFKLFVVRSHSLIIFATILGMLPCSFGSVVGLPVGIWILIKLSRSEIIRAFETVKTFDFPVERLVKPLAAPQKSPLTTDSPRYSRKAIVGAFWAHLLFLVALSFVPISRNVEYSELVQNDSTQQGTAESNSAVDFVDERPQGSRPLWQWPLIFILLPLGFLAPFDTTILGIVAISDIRHSMSRLVGLPLAVADALFFPLLALDGLIVLAFELAYLGFDRFPHNAFNLYLAISIGVLVAVVVDCLIAKSVWRKAAH